MAHGRDGAPRGRTGQALLAGLLAAASAAHPGGARAAAPGGPAAAAVAAAGSPAPRAFPLGAVGKLNVVTGPGSRQHCTATLIGPRHALTAAHCLYDRARRVWVDPRGVHFVAGYATGAYAAHAIARSYTKPEGYGFGTGRDSFARDWAIVELADALPVRPVRIGRAAGGPGGAWSGLAHAGYRVGADQVPTVETGCGARLEPGEGASPVLGGGCRIGPGESGSALIDLSGDEPAVVGVLVAATGVAEMPSLAVPASAFLPAAEAALTAAR